ncbi:MAG TPA: tetratricopeptide repeat protein [Candidatus Methylomirabilis sp.]|nr:tetratricopeptide repeat protein [Candidatus Methylomirabilis sp.]
MSASRIAIRVFSLAVMIASLPNSFLPAQAQAPAPTQQRPQQPEFIRQGQQLMRQGKLDDALTLYQETLKSSPDSLPANLAAGSVLDLMGKGEEARKYFQKAIEVAGTPERKAMAERSMAMSHAFESNCTKAIEYEQKVFDYYVSVNDFYQQGEMADEGARVCLDSHDLHNTYPAEHVAMAAEWYQRGHDVGLKEPNIKPERVDLWNFRWENAQARIAARRGQKAEAEKHVAAAKALFDQGKIPEQAPFVPYLEGYVAFFLQDYKSALENFLKANQNDAFIQCMLGRSYEKLGEKDKAIESYRKAAAAISHNPPAAYAVPFSKKRLAVLQK